MGTAAVVPPWMAIHRALLLTLLLVGFALNLQLIDRFPLREDEALYSYWARSFRQEDPLMRTVWPDKPPLFIWTQALVFEGMGATQSSARLLNLALTTLTTALLAATGRRLWQNRQSQRGHPEQPGHHAASEYTAILSATGFALNPFVISFAATAYTDPLLVFCGQLACYLALRGQAFGAGLWLAAAIMTKQQGLLYLPLVLLPLFWASQQRGQDLMRWLLGCALIGLPIFYWDSLRWAVAPSPWDLSVRNYVPLTLAPLATWSARSAQWGDLLWYFTANRWVWLVYAIVLLSSLIIGVRDRRCRPQARLRAFHHSFPEFLLFIWGGGYLLLHVVTTIHVWDRYLLPLIPVAILLFAALVARLLTAIANSKITQCVAPIWAITPIFLCVLLLIPTAADAAQGAFPIGGDHGAYTGLVKSISWIQATNEPFVLYHQRLGWHYQFYLFDERHEDTGTLRWFANAVYLADNAAKTPDQRRFLIQPSWYQIPNLNLGLTTRNMHLETRAHFGEMTLYEIINLPQQPCSWCRCAPATLDKINAILPWSLYTNEGLPLLSPVTTDP